MREARRRTLKTLGMLSLERERHINHSSEMLAAILRDPGSAATSLLITYLDPEIIENSAPHDAPDTFEQDTIVAIAAEIDRRIPIPER